MLQNGMAGAEQQEKKKSLARDSEGSAAEIQDDAEQFFFQAVRLLNFFPLQLT